MGSLRKRHLEEMEVKEEEAGGCTNSLTLIDTAKEACKSVNLCARLKEGIEVPIHTFKEREDMGRGEMWEDRRERLKTEYQARNRIEILHMREMRESGRTMGTISEEREGGEDAKESDSKKRKTWIRT